jgi:hypothetical protein
VAFLRFGMAGHGFRRAEIEEAVTQTIAESPFGQARIVETGSTFRIELTRSA